jgi:predicted RNase H-related nuclease YkuK (DUF458 family)
MNIQEVIEFIRTTSSETRVYVGCDSSVRNCRGAQRVTYATVVVVHIDGSRGCRVFGQVETVKEYGSLKQRLFNEALRAGEMAFQILPHVGDRELEVHLDINCDTNCASHIAVKEAAGYIMGLLGFQPRFKPDAPVATGCADRFAGLAVA